MSDGMKKLKRGLKDVSDLFGEKKPQERQLPEASPPNSFQIVNAICPGNLLDSPLWVDSLFKQYARTRGMTEDEVRQYYMDQVPLGRGCTYEDVCNVLVFLASNQSSYMTGQAVNVTGGQEMH